MQGWRGKQPPLYDWLLRYRRPVLAVVALLAATALLLAVFLGRSGTIADRRRELAALRNAQQSATALQARLREQLASTSDPAVLEDKARELLGLVKPGEVKVIFTEDNTP